MSIFLLFIMLCIMQEDFTTAEKNKESTYFQNKVRKDNFFKSYLS